jgi:hypothetical protein
MAGNVITDAQNNAPSLQWSEVVTKFFSMHNGLSVVPFNFKNYWVKGKANITTVVAMENRVIFMANMAAINTTISKKILPMQRHRVLLLGKSTCSTAVFAENMSARLQNFDNMPTADNKPRNFLSVPCTIMVQLMRCMAVTPGGEQLLRSFFQVPSPRQPQRGLFAEAVLVGRFHDEPWIRRYLHETCVLVQEHLYTRICVERFVIGHLRASDDRSLEKYLDTMNFEHPQVVIKNWPTKAQFNSCKNTLLALSLKSSSNWGGHWNFSIYCGMMVDLLDTIMVYGFDPDFSDRCVYDANVTDEMKTRAAELNDRKAGFHDVVIEELTRKMTEKCKPDKEIFFEENADGVTDDDGNVTQVRVNVARLVDKMYRDSFASKEEHLSTCKNVLLREYLT